MQGPAPLRAFVESLYGLTGRQWVVILSLLVCANLIVYGALGWLFYRYLIGPAPAPAFEIERVPTPTLRPTYTPTWTATLASTDTPARVATATATEIPLPTLTATHVPTSTLTVEPTSTLAATLGSQ